MRMKVTLTTVALIAALAGCAVFAYLWIDRSITLSYIKQSVDAGNASTRRLERLMGAAWAGMPESAVLEKLQAEAARHPNENIVVKREDGVIWFDETRFNFEQGRLKSIGGT
jgi:HAMP domain-containing protein